jgi:hypothetical protein
MCLYPTQGQGLEINLETLAVTRTLNVGGTPGAVAVFGWWGVLGDAHEHEHDP